MDTSVHVAMTATSEVMQKIDEAEKVAHDNLNAVMAIKKYMADNVILDQCKNISTKLEHMTKTLHDLQKEFAESNSHCMSLQKTNYYLVYQVQQLQEEKTDLRIQLSNCKEVDKMLQEKVSGQSDLNSVKQSTQASYVESDRLNSKEPENLNWIEASTLWLNANASSWLRQTSKNTCKSLQHITVIPSSSFRSKTQLQHQSTQSQIQQNMGTCLPNSESTTEQSEILLTPTLSDQSLQNQSGSSLSATMSTCSTSEDSLEEEKSNIIENLEDDKLKSAFKKLCKKHKLTQVNTYTSTIYEEMDMVVCEMRIHGKKLKKQNIVTMCHGYYKKQARVSCMRSILPQLVELGLDIPNTEKLTANNNEPLFGNMTEVEKLNKLRSQIQWLNAHAPTWLSKTPENASESPQNATIIDPVLQNHHDTAVLSPIPQQMGICAHSSENIMQKSTHGHGNGMSLPASITQPVSLLQEQESTKETTENKQKKKKNIKVTEVNAMESFTQFCYMHNLKPLCKIISNGPKKSGYTCEMSVHVNELGQTLFAKKSDCKRGYARRSCSYSILLQLYCSDVKGITLTITKQEAVEILTAENAKNTDSSPKSEIKNTGCKKTVTKSPKDGNIGKAKSNKVLEPFELPLDKPKRVRTRSKQKALINSHAKSLQLLQTSDNAPQSSRNSTVIPSPSFNAIVSLPNQPKQNQQNTIKTPSSVLKDVEILMRDLKNRKPQFAEQRLANGSLVQGSQKVQCSNMSITVPPPVEKLAAPLKKTELQNKSIKISHGKGEKSNSEIAINNIKMENVDEDVNMEILNSKDLKIEIAKSIKMEIAKNLNMEIPTADGGEPMKRIEEEKPNIGNVIVNTTKKFNHFCTINKINFSTIRLYTG